MKKKWFPLFLLCAWWPAFCLAEPATLPGDYIRNLTDARPDSVDFTVIQKDHIWSVIAFDSYLEATRLTDVQLSPIWHRLKWHIAGNTSALACVKFDMQAICYLPPDASVTDSSGRRLTSGYYYYDPLSGVTRLHKRHN